MVAVILMRKSGAIICLLIIYFKNTSSSQQRSLLQVGDLRSLENSTKLLIVCIPTVNRWNFQRLTGGVF